LEILLQRLRGFAPLEKLLGMIHEFGDFGSVCGHGFGEYS
jgi:hypothetical protein